MSIEAIRGGAACAKEILCNPPAVARAINEARLATAKLKGVRDLSAAIRSGLVTLNESQQAAYTVAVNVMAYPAKFKAAYEHLWQSMVVKV